jgi:glutamyl-tRNA reductase
MLTIATMSHHTAPIGVREQIAIAAENVGPVITRAQATLGQTAIIATCNRLELYVSGSHDSEKLFEFIQQETGADAESVRKHFHIHHDTEGVRHLYRVAAGLESMVIGESEILGQIRTAFSDAADVGIDDTILVRLFHGAIRAGRRARNETAIGHRALSVSSIAVQQARELHGDLSAARVLVIGAGEAGRLTGEALVAQGAREVTVVNRTVARAEALAAELGGKAAAFDDLPEAIAMSDVIVAASGAPDTLIDLETMRTAVERREGAPLLIIDIGMPRDVDPEAGKLPGISYHDMESLQAIAAANSRARAEEIGAVEIVLAEEVSDFSKWWEQLRTHPTIAAINGRAETIRRESVEKSLRRLGADEVTRQEIDGLTRAIVKRLLHDPITTLREHGDQDGQYIEVARMLFRLDDDVPAAVSADTRNGTNSGANDAAG